MKLYFSPGACALASQITLREAGYKFDLVKVDLKEKTSPDGDFRAINPKGYIPVLKLDSGEFLTEGAAILQWIADQKPETKLLPKAGTMERYRAIEWLNYISTELHKGIGGLFNPVFNEAARANIIERANLRLEVIENHLKKNKFMLGQEFSAVDAYLFNIVRWTGFVKMDISKFPTLVGFMDAIGQRPTVQASIEAENAQKTHV